MIATVIEYARACADQLAAKGVKLVCVASVNHSTNPVRKRMLTTFATRKELAPDLIRSRTGEGMVIARAKGPLRGKRHQPSDKQQKQRRRMFEIGGCYIRELVKEIVVLSSTVHRSLHRNSAHE